MAELELSEQPLTGFDYSYWFECATCGTRVNIAADLYELQTAYTPERPQAEFSRCGECGTEVDVTELRPLLRNLDDIARQDDWVDRLYWYHSSNYENWPDSEAYADAYKERIANGRFSRGGPLRNSYSPGGWTATSPTACRGHLFRYGSACTQAR